MTTVQACLDFFTRLTWWGLINKCKVSTKLVYEWITNETVWPKDGVTKFGVKLWPVLTSEATKHVLFLEGPAAGGKSTTLQKLKEEGYYVLSMDYFGNKEQKPSTVFKQTEDAWPLQKTLEMLVCINKCPASKIVIDRSPFTSIVYTTMFKQMVDQLTGAEMIGCYGRSKYTFESYLIKIWSTMHSLCPRVSFGFQFMMYNNSDIHYKLRVECKGQHDHLFKSNYSELEMFYFVWMYKVFETCSTLVVPKQHKQQPKDDVDGLGSSLLLDMLMTSVSNMCAELSTAVCNSVAKYFADKLTKYIGPVNHQILMTDNTFEGCKDIWLANNFGGNAGIDLALANDVVLKPRDFICTCVTANVMFYTKLWGMITNKSSSISKYNVNVLTGVVDSLYTGPMFVSLQNLLDKEVHIKAGTAIAQLIPIKHITKKQRLVCRSNNFINDVSKYYNLDNIRGNKAHGATTSQLSKNTT